MLVNIYEVVVGDIMHLEAGDVVPVDGVLLDGYNVSSDESAATGESDAMVKVPAALALSNTPPTIKFMEEYDPFILSGSKVLGGVGTFVVTAVGPNSFNGRTLMCNCLNCFSGLTVSDTGPATRRYASSDQVEWSSQHDHESWCRRSESLVYHSPYQVFRSTSGKHSESQREREPIRANLNHFHRHPRYRGSRRAPTGCYSCSGLRHNTNAEG
jgi:hypothetical protein